MPDGLRADEGRDVTQRAKDRVPHVGWKLPQCRDDGPNACRTVSPKLVPRLGTSGAKHVEYRVHEQPAPIHPRGRRPAVQRGDDDGCLGADGVELDEAPVLDHPVHGCMLVEEEARRAHHANEAAVLHQHSDNATPRNRLAQLCRVLVRLDAGTRGEREAGAVVVEDAPYPAVGLVVAGKRRVLSKVTSFAVAAHIEARVALSRDVLQVRPRAYLAGDSLLEHEVEILLTACERVVGASIGDVGRPLGQEERNGRELLRRTAGQLANVAAHLQFHEARRLEQGRKKGVGAHE